MIIRINPEASIIVKIVFVHADSLIPIKFTIERIISKPIAEIIIGMFTNSAKYPPNPNATVAAVIMDVIAVSQPIRKAKNYFKCIFMKTYSAAALGKIDDNSA